MTSKAVNSAWESREGEYLLWGNHGQGTGQISYHSDDNTWQVNKKPGLPEGNKFLGIWSALYDSLQHQISSHNTEPPTIPSPQTSTDSCGPICSCWFNSNPRPIIPVLQLPSHSQTTSQNPLRVPSVLSRISPLISVLESSQSSACSIPHYTVAWTLQAWALPKGICFLFPFTDYSTPKFFVRSAPSIRISP